MRLFVVLTLLIVGFAESIESRAGVLVPERPALYAGFDNKTAGQLIGTRGAMFGEPVFLSALDALVVETVPGQYVLRISNDLSSTSARRMRWSLLDGAEINTGEVRISFDLKASALDRFSFYVRESAGTSNAFLSLAFNDAGSIIAADANGNIGGTPNAYAADVPLHVELIFDMNARTSTVMLGNITVVSGRAFGIANRGIGSVLIGYGSGNSGSPFDLDNLRISGQLPFPVALEADFEDKVAGLPIGLDGAAVHEPHSQDAGLNAIVVEEAPGVNILDLASTNTSSAKKLRWQFLDNLEIRTGLFVLDFDVKMTTRDRYSISLRERASSTKNFMALTFQDGGGMTVNDENGATFLPGVTYNAGQVYQFRTVHDMDAGIYEIFRDGIPLLRERASGVTSRGIGAALYSISNGAQISAHMQIDSLRVYSSAGASISSDLEFLQEASTAVENQPVTPVFEVGVVNILDQPVPDGTPVSLEIAQGSGPTGAALGGATATTTAGIAVFPSLTFDTPGTYRLIARSSDAVALNAVDIIVEPSDALFANGFD